MARLVSSRTCRDAEVLHRVAIKVHVTRFHPHLLEHGERRGILVHGSAVEGVGELSLKAFLETRPRRLHRQTASPYLSDETIAKVDVRGIRDELEPHIPDGP